ncbi:MAG: Na/Pi cotransporter family protein [Sphaerochaetaceae bacterium]|nr:Na/Pi cotransporter family protein [Sphaerochaetaceae bacterium]
MKIVAGILQFFGSIGLFIFGMKMMSQGLQKVAGKRIESILHFMTGHRIVGIFTGILVTILIQSSSATTVMVVGFANAGFINLVQAINVIMGANIGTTVSAWIVSLFGFKFDIVLVAFLLLFVSFPMQFVKKEKVLDLADVFAGLGILFIGLFFIQKAIPDVSENVALFEFFRRLSEPTVLNMILCTVLGMLITGIIQASAASMALTITLAYQGWIGPYAACALCLGQNIGTTITALLSSIGTNVNARRAAVAHTLFNVIGSVIALLFLKPLMNLVNYITPGDVFTATSTELSSILPFYLSMFHTIFNVLNTVIFFPFTKYLAKFIETILPETENKDVKKKYAFSVSSAISYSSTPELYLGAVRDEIAKLGELTLGMIKDFRIVISHPNEDMGDVVNKMRADEDYADDMQDVLTSLCVKLMKQSPSSGLVNKLTCYIRGIDELESITDSCFTLVCDAKKRRDEGYVFSKEAETRILYYVDMVTEYLSYINEHIKTSFSKNDLMKAYEFENKINKERSSLVDYVEKRMQVSSDNIQKELLLFDMTRHLEHIGDFCTNIAQSYSKLAA